MTYKKPRDYDPAGLEACVHAHWYVAAFESVPLDRIPGEHRAAVARLIRRGILTCDQRIVRAVKPARPKAVEYAEHYGSAPGMVYRPEREAP